MVSRRAPRWVYWPGKLLWAPSLFFGLLLTSGAWPQIDARGEGTWSVIVSIGTPDAWVADLGMFLPGVFLLVIGLVAFGLYTRTPWRPNRLTMVEFPLFTIAAWALGLLAFLSFLRFDGHVAGIGMQGFDWRFLAHARTTTIDLVTGGLSIAGSIACWLLSWGLAESDADEGHQYRHTA